MRSGLRFSLKSGEYYPLTISPLNPRKCWEPEFQYALRDIAGDTYPQADYVLEGVDAHVRYSKLNSLGIDILKGSKPYDQRRPSKSEVVRVQEQIEQIHALANDSNIPTDRREFFRNLQLPDPRYMPECWRVTGLFKKHLHILWGISKGGKHSTFLPASAHAGSWDDQKNRVPLGDALGMPDATPLANSAQKTVGALNGQRKTGFRANFLHWLLNTLTFGWYGRHSGRSGIGRSGGCLGRIISMLIRLVLIYLLFSLFRGCIPGCPSRFGRGPAYEPGVSMPGGLGGGSSGGDTDIDGGSGEGCNMPDGSGDGRDGPGKDCTAPDIPPELGGSAPSNDMDVKKPGENPDQNQPTDSQEKDPNDESAKAEDAAPDLAKEDPKQGEDAPPQPKNDPPPVSNLESVQALACRFKVNPPKELSGSNADVARVEFSISAIDDLKGKEFIVSDWKINDEVLAPGESKTFSPSEGLRYDKTYTVTAVVTVDGNPQRVEPFQWNTVDQPTWQILEYGRNIDNAMRQYKLVCCNSSSIKPFVTNWKVSFRTKDKKEDKALDFGVESRRVGDNLFEMKKNIGFFEGAYFMEMSADVEYVVRGRTNCVTHVETFPFTHDSSADGLTKAKYEVVIPNVYFCLAKLEDGSLINGTAFAISEKLLLSNYHVAVGGIPESYVNSGNYKIAGPVTLTNVKGKTFYAKVDRSDRGRDLAILRLCDKAGKEVDDRLPGYLHLSEDSLVSGISETATRHVFAIGYPKGTVCMGPPAFTDGKAEKIFKRDYDWRGKHESFDTILNYASTKCGYSGGPLIDYQTETVLGVNFGGLVEKLEGHKAAALATSAKEVRIGFPSITRGE